MVTFLPYADFVASARVLDNKRLGKQRVEAYQIINVITKPRPGSTAWANHPAVRMWRGSVHLLAHYYNTMCMEWALRGFVNNMEWINPTRNWDSDSHHHVQIAHPCWLGDPVLHSSHRATLLSKNLEWYSQFNWTEEPLYYYVWPLSKQTS